MGDLRLLEFFLGGWEKIVFWGCGRDKSRPYRGASDGGVCRVDSLIK